jgi:membrane dipeptidase
VTTADGAALNVALARSMLSRFPLIDGHNDLPWVIRKSVDKAPGKAGLTKRLSNTHTDIPRLVEGGVGGQFWSVYVPGTLGKDEAVTMVLEQIDIVYRMLATYPDRFRLALTADDIGKSFADGKIASLLGAEGGHSIGGSLGVLRTLYRLGVRYMTLTHNQNVGRPERLRPRSRPRDAAPGHAGRPVARRAVHDARRPGDRASAGDLQPLLGPRGM